MLKCINGSNIDMDAGGISEVSFNLQKDPSVDCDVFNTNNYYYGKTKKISADDDISSLTRGSVYYLKDHMNDPNSTIHPYIVIQSSYVDKVSRITLLGITSTPSTVNMVPIVMENSISYINPNRVYTYNIDVFSDPSSRLIGNVVNTNAFDIAVNLYGMSLGMDLKKSNEEIISDYLTYIDDFKERTKHLGAYQSKVIKSNGRINKLELHTEFGSKSMPMDTDDMTDETYNIDIDDSDNLIDDNTDEIDIVVPEVYEDINIIVDDENKSCTRERVKKTKIDPEALEKAIKLYRRGNHTVGKIEKLTGISRSSLYREIRKRENIEDTENNSGKPRLIVDVNNQAVLATISVLEDTPAGKIKLPRKISDMGDDEKVVFITYDFLYGAEQTAILYNCSYQTILKKKNQICDQYDIIYK